MGWFELLCEGLLRNDLVSTGAQVPFGVLADTEVEWQAPLVTQRENGLWELTSGSPQGIEAAWRVRRHSGTGALECSGSVRNAGREALSGVRELATLDLAVGMVEGWGEPFVRTVNGARFCPGFFPPDDFRSRDRQLLRMWKQMAPLSITALQDGRSSGHSLPCLILAGEAGDRGIAMFYEWSGLWRIGIEPDSLMPGFAAAPWTVRLKAAIWGLDFDLRPGEEVPLPNLLLVGFDGDLDAGGNALRRHIGRHVAPTIAGSPPLPPVSFNHFFAFENEFDAALLEPAAEACSQAGVEYFCVDGGWHPGGFRVGIGNWSQPDPAKFPEGIAPFARRLRDLDLKMGLWFEPEYAHVDSELYRAHPEWFIQGPASSPWTKPGELFYLDRPWEGVEPFSGRDFGLVDFGQEAARQWWIDRIVEAYERWEVRWIRWDANQQPRPHWDQAEPGRRGLSQIDHFVGLYEVWDEILRACPDLFVEQCASGGHRIDLGTVRRGHAFWMNDHTTHSDVVRAMQHGLNTVLPGIYANTNLCQARFDFDEYDYLSHGGGSFGFSGRLHEAPRDAFESYRAAVERFKGYRHLLGGEYSRPTGNPQCRFDHAQVSWSDGGETVEMEFNLGGRPRSAEIRQRHAG